MTDSSRVNDAVNVAETLDQYAQARVALEAEIDWAERDPAELAHLAQAANLAGLAATHPNFGLAKSLLDGGFTVVALDGQGQVVPEFAPCRDELAAAEWWASHPDDVPGAAAGFEAANLYALDLGAIGGQGVGWVKQACYEPPPPDAVPDEIDGWGAREPGWQRDPLGYPITLLEGPPLTGPRRRQTAVAVGAGRIYRAWDKVVRPLSPPMRTVWCWEWPSDGAWQLPKPGTRVADSVRVMAAVPVPGAMVAMDGRSWRAANSMGRLQPLPPYLAEAVGGKRLGPNGRAARLS